MILIYLIAQKPNVGFDPDGPKNFIIKQLDFDVNQIKTYEELIDQHRKDIRENDRKIQNLKKNLYSLLLNENKQKADSLALEIGKIQTKIETIHFNHFLDIKALCKPNQINNFNMLSYELLEVFNHNKQPKKAHQ